MQCDLWFPAKVIPDGAGALLAPPVLTMVAAYSRFVMAVMLPTRTSGDLLAGMWALLATSLGASPKTLVWDNEAGIGQRHRLTVGARGFAGTLGTRIYQTAARDPEAKGMVERANQFLQTSFMPGRSFTSGVDFNAQLAGWLPAANTRLVRATGARPVDLLAADRAAMGVLPPIAPATGTTSRVRLGRDYYVHRPSPGSRSSPGTWTRSAAARPTPSPPGSTLRGRGRRRRSRTTRATPTSPPGSARTPPTPPM